MWLNKRQLHSHFVFPQVPPGRGCKQSQPVLGTRLSKSFVFNLSSNLLELMMAVPPNSGWIFIYESLGKGKTKAERKSLLTFPVPLSSSSPWQALSPLARTSHTLFPWQSFWLKRCHHPVLSMPFQCSEPRGRSRGDTFDPSQPPWDTTSLHFTADFLCRQKARAGLHVLVFKQA